MNHMSGITLLELVTVMTIVGIIAAIGVPSFKYVTSSNRVASEMNALVGDLQYARTEAIKEGLPITVCASSNGTQCSGAGNTTWQTGWIIFPDLNSNQTVDAGETVLRVQNAFTKAFGGTDTLTSNDNFTALTFNREGFGSTNTGNTQIVTVTLHTTPAVSQWTRCLAITTIGMFTTETPTTPNPLTACT